MCKGAHGTNFIQMIVSKLGISVFPSVSLELHGRDENWKRQYFELLFLKYITHIFVSVQLCVEANKQEM